MAPKVAIVIYSMYGHIAKLAEAELEGIKAAGGEAKIFQIPETLPQNVLDLLHAPAKPDHPIIDPVTLATYDAFVLGVPTRFGNFPAQWKAFWDSTGGLWAQGALSGKYVGAFYSTAGLGGGQESTAIAVQSTFVHHGMIYVPFGNTPAAAKLFNVPELRGGSPWGAGTFAGSDGSRQPSPLELEIATLQGKQFYGVVSKAF